jgi:ComF family protein
VQRCAAGDKAGDMTQLALPRAIARGIIDYALPPRCPGCGTIVEDDHRFCFECWGRLDFLGEPCCARCGLPFAFAEADGAECGRCIAEPPSYERLRAAVSYGEIARKVALKLKYSGRPGVARTMARLMERQAGGGEARILVPVPLHRWRIWTRGYNQAAVLAGELAGALGGRVESELMERVKRTPPLRGMGRRERIAAMRGAFRVAPRRREEVRGGSFILVDDVFTSGATTGACAKVLKRAGAARVEIICWARVIRDEEAG